MATKFDALDNMENLLSKMELSFLEFHRECDKELEGVDSIGNSHTKEREKRREFSQGLNGHLELWSFSSYL